MKALVVYESMFGNTRAVARAIARGLDPYLPATLHECSEAPTRIRDDVTLVVAGAPTHAFGLPRARTRASAAEESDASLVSPGAGLREWLDTVTFTGTAAPAVAAFDTKIGHPRLPGSAAAKALRRLRRTGGRPAAPSRTFTVLGMTGPLSEGEEASAEDWGARLGASVTGGLSMTRPS